jgi:hypothetical protein
MHQTLSNELKEQTISQAMDQLLLQTADPLPVLHQDGSVGWQGEVGVGPVVSRRLSTTTELQVQEELHHAAGP